MGGGSGGGTSTSNTTASIAPELKPFFKATGERAEAFQGAAPLTPFAAPRPTGVAPLSSTERAGISGAGTVGDRPAGESGALSRISEIPGLASRRVETGQRVDFSPLTALASRRVTGEGIEDAPSINAARLAFRSGAQPNIESELALRGLGRSTAVAPALARAEAEFLYPAVQDELAREERRLERELGVATTGVGLEERGLERDIGLEERGQERELGANLQTVPFLLSAGGSESARELAAIDAQLKAGGVERGVAQSRENAAAQDFLRRQALSETALFSPLGSVLPSAIGSKQVTESSGGK